jgi:hypothetical protein
MVGEDRTAGTDLDPTYLVHLAVLVVAEGSRVDVAQVG